MDIPGDKDLRSILQGLQGSADNPIARARKMVELEVPPERRGPGWDRHWRELEAYLDHPGRWPMQGDEQDAEHGDDVDSEE